MKGIFNKSIIIVSTAVLLVSVYFIAGVLIFANRQYYEINTANLEEAARIIKNFTPHNVFTDSNAAMEWAELIRDTTASYRITLINRNGQVIFDTDADSGIMENHLDRAEFQSAVRNGIGTSSRRSTTMGEYQLYAAIAIYDSGSSSIGESSVGAGELTGILRLSYLVSGFFPRLLRSTLLYLIIGLGIILFACAGIFHYSRRLSNFVETNLQNELEVKTTELSTRAKEAESENRYREAILNSMFDGLLSLDKNLKIIHANTKLCSLFGIEKERASGMSLLEFTSSTELAEAAQQVLITGGNRELRLKRFLPGNRQYFQVFIAAIEDGLVMVIGDISRLVKLEQVRKDFAANVSHELRTPIQVIKGFTENILDSTNDLRMDDPSNSTHHHYIEEIRHFADLISKNVLNMENITNDLLTLVSLESEETNRPKMTEEKLLPVINLAVSMVENTAKKKNISIDVSCSDDLSIKIHESLFIQALVNLLDNGIKYSNEGTPISINVYTKNEENSNKIIIEVKDRGIGIPAEHMERIFERFYRVDRSRSREAGGTGLGLSIVRHIALLHNGNIEAESHVGEGSLFRLTL